MTSAELELEIYTRLVSDSGSGGLTTLVDNIANTDLPRGVAADAFVVFEVTSGEQDDGADHDLVLFTVVFTVSSPTDADCRNALARLYRLMHRWKIGENFGATQDAGIFRRVSSATEHNRADERWVYVETYQVEVSDAANIPVEPE